MRPVLFLILFCSALFAEAQTITVPSTNGANTAGSNSIKRKPLGTYYGYEWSALILTKAELGFSSAQSINTISFYLDTLTATPAATTPVKVYMREITDTAFSASTTPANELAGATLVFDGTLSSTDFVSGSWTNIPLNIPFNYTNNNNLEIIVQANAGGTGSDASASAKEFRRNSTTVKRFQYWQQDNTVPFGTGTLDTLRPNIKLGYNISLPCTGTPTAGMASAADSAVCSGGSTELSLSGTTLNTGITFQWQESADGMNFTNINGATAANYTYSNITDTLYFRCIVSCGGNADTSNTGTVTIKNPVYCYCTTSLGGGCNGYSIDSLSIENTAFQASLNGCENNMAPHYSSYTPTGNYTATLTAGQTYTITIRQTGNNITSMWIDYNHNGVFEATEWKQINTTSVTNGLLSASFTVDTNAYNGLTGMRVRSRANGSLNDSTTACTGFITGETEDFLVTITGGLTIGIENKISENEQFVVFPNPNNGRFSVMTQNNCEIELVNLLGETVIRQQAQKNQKTEFDMNVQPGVYFIRAIDKESKKVLTRKIIIE